MPIPVLALLSFVGLVVYGMVGAVVGAVTVRALGGKPDMRQLADDLFNSPDFGVFGWAATLWPAWLAMVAIGGLFAVPVWCAGKVGSYVAGALSGGAD